MVNPVGGTNPVSENQYNPSQKTLNDYNTAITDFNANPPNYAGAYKAFTDILASDKIFPTQHPEVYYYAGLAAQYANDPSIPAGAAKKLLQDYLNTPNPDASMAQSAQGQIDVIDGQDALSANDYEGALAAFEKAGKDDPALAPNLKNTIGQIKGQIDLDKANEAQQNNDLAGMLKWYEQAAKDCPEMAPQLTSTIASLQAQVKWNDEQPAINALMNQAQDTMYPPNGEQGHPQAAINILKSVLEQYPDAAQNDPSIYFTMAQYAWQGADVDQAKAYFAEFEPSISQIPVAGNEQFLAGVAYLHEQLGGDNSRLANWATYGANWLSHLTGIKSEWWQNTLLNAAQGVMPNSDRLNALNAKMRFGKHLKNEGYHVQRESDALKPLQEQAQKLRSALATAKSGAEVKQINEDLKSNEQSQEEIWAIRGGAKSPEGAQTQRSFKWGGDVTSTRHRTGSLDQDPSQPQHVNKGEGAAEDPSGPGFWGLGTTLQQAQAKFKSFGDISASNPYTLASGGSGLSDYQESAYGGANLFNAEARTFQMVYGGGTAAGFGYQNMYGAQARADLFDESYGVNYAGGDASIGGQTFSLQTNNALASGNASESVSLGATQADAHGALAIGTEGVHIGGNAGAFAGAAQGNVSASGSLLGQGGYAMAQGWVGAGAKLNANLGIGPNGLHFDLGIGAALGIGGYVQLSGNINFEAMGQDIASIYGTGEHTIIGMAGRAGELASSAVSAAGSAVSNIAGGVDSVIGDAQNYFADNALSNLKAGGVKTLEGVGEGIGEIATDVADETAAPILDAAKNIGHVASEVGSDFSKGEIGKGLGEIVVGGAKAVWNTVKDVAKTVWGGIKNFFSGW